LFYWFVLAVAGLAHPPQRFEFEHAAMGTTFRIVLYAVDAERGSQASAKAFRRIDALDRILSDYDTSSEISRLSTTAGSGQWIAVSDDLWAILEYSNSLAIETGGAFDVTIGPLTRLWRWASRREQLPDADRIARARAAVGHTLVEFDTSVRRVRLTAPGMRLDVGAVGKGFAADAALEILEREGIHRALVDAGGDVVASDAPPGSSGWRVAVPELHGGTVATRTVRIANCAVATSGDTYRYFEVDGVRYSHIIDPESGIGLTTRRIATVFAPNATEADALASAVSVLDGAQAAKLLDARRDVSGSVYELDSTNWQTVYASSELPH